MLRSTSQQDINKGIFFGFFIPIIYIELYTGISCEIYTAKYKQTIGGPSHVWELMLTISIASMLVGIITMFLVSRMQYSDSIQKYKRTILLLQMMFYCLLIWNMYVNYSMTDDVRKYWESIAAYLFYYVHFYSDLLWIFASC